MEFSSSLFGYPRGSRATSISAACRQHRNLGASKILTRLPYWEDLMRNDDFDRRTGLDREDTKKGAMMLGIIALVAVGGALFLWAPWHGPRTADSSSPGSTVGSTTTRPDAPASPPGAGPTTTRIN